MDAGTDLGALNNPAWYQNASKLGGGDLARLEDAPPRTTRAWGNTMWYYDDRTGEYHFNHETFDQVDAYTDRMLVNFDQCDQVLMTLAAPQKCREVLKTGIRHHKMRYPGLQYIEFFNESDKRWPLAPGEEPGLPVRDYYEWYKIGYSVVNEINNELHPAVPLRIGGPAAFEFDVPYLTAFLDLYAADTDTGKRLDFLSFHEYAHGADPAWVQREKSTVQSWLDARGLGTIPVFITEYGVFPGTQSGKDAGGNPTTLAADQLTHAAAMATLGTYFVQGGVDMPMHWVHEHSNVRKSMFVADDDGAVYPYFNVVKMQNMLKARRISATSGALTAGGIGVSAMATKDDTGVAVLSTNYQWTKGTATHDVTLTVNNLPASLAGRQVLVERYLVDATTSNYAADPAKSDLTRVERYVLPVGHSAVARPYTLTPNAVSLVVLTPVGFAEAEALTPATSAGDRADDVADPVASGGALSVFQPNAVGDFETFTLQAPADGPYHVGLRVKHAPTRGRARASVNGVALGEPIDLYSTGYEFEDLDLGVRTLRAGSNTVTLTVTAPGTGGGYSIGVDTLTLQPADAGWAEAESHVPVSPSGDQVLVLTEAAASATGYVVATTDTVGDSVRYRVRGPGPGAYRLIVGVKKFPSRGICQYAVDGVDVGTPQDQYATTATYAPQEVGVVTLRGTAPMTITCTITGRNPASTGYGQGLDYVRFEPADVS
ncbi:hypothetical protein [Actinoplanes sp. NPDC049316]|uniref:hypothetical protein n=1 Tax=Actinoplanes sp. NPDC049316 TaxID=3154727 RepID=UPI0034396A2D